MISFWLFETNDATSSLFLRRTIYVHFISRFRSSSTSKGKLHKRLALRNREQSPPSVKRKGHKVVSKLVYDALCSFQLMSETHEHTKDAKFVMENKWSNAPKKQSSENVILFTALNLCLLCCYSSSDCLCPKLTGQSYNNKSTKIMSKCHIYGIYPIYINNIFF